MQKFGIAVLILSALGSPAHAVVRDDLSIFTDKDMYALAEKLEKSLRKCKEVRWHPEIIVDLRNNSDEFIDKSKFSELIHSMLERKTHTSPEENPPQYEVRAILTSESQRMNETRKTTYRLTAEVMQEEEQFCKRSVMLTKLSNLGPNKNKSDQPPKANVREPTSPIPQ